MELDKSTLENLIREVVREELNNVINSKKADPRNVDPSGVIGLDPDDFALRNSLSRLKVTVSG